MAQEEAKHLGGGSQYRIGKVEMSLDDKIKSLISMGGEITGPAAGSAIGFLVGGPGGAAVGGLSGVIISRGLSDITGRLLSKREKVRVGATATYAITKVKARLDSGDELRNDGFFQDKGKGRTDAEEIFEGVLLKAKNEHEEKKARILGNIFANTAFFPGFSVGEANHLLRIADNLTYRKMCILSLIKRKDEIEGIKLRQDYYGYELDYEKMSYETISLLQEAFDIRGDGLIVCKDEFGEGIIAMTEWNDICPNTLELTQMGERYYQVMGLDDISEEDVLEVAGYLS